MTGERPRAYDTPRLQAWRRRTDLPLTVLAIGSLPILLLELQRNQLTQTDQLMLDVVNVVVLVAFGVDYLVELGLAGNRRQFVRSEWTSLAIVVTQGLTLLPSLAGFGAFRALRGVRLLRLVVTFGRLFALGGIANRQGRSVLRRNATAFAIGTAGLTWVTSAVAFTLAEDVGEDGRLQSFFDALWWSSATITTVGYGDIYPVTTAGRIVGVFTMVVGISTFAVVTAKVAEFLVRTDPAPEPAVDVGSDAETGR